MKLRKLLPTLLLALALVYYLLPGGTGSTPQSAPTERPSGGLSLVTSTPRPTSTPSSAPSSEPGSDPAAWGPSTPFAPPSPSPEKLDENGSYTTKEDVALYLRTYGHLPPNFVTKKEAEAAGWTSGSLEKVMPGKCLGGDYFGNYEGKLPKAKGRKWFECDINTLGARKRGPERLIYSNDGLIYYSPDHYESVERLYG